MKYSEKFKAKMVEKMTGPDACSATSLAGETGVSQQTLSRWLKTAKVRAVTQDDNPPKGSSSRKRSATEKLRIYTASSVLKDDELGEFLRREGLHEAELRALQKEVREAAVEGLQPKAKRRGLSGEQKRIRKLEKELKRKEKALAETAALLVLQGKVQAFLASQDEEGDTES